MPADAFKVTVRYNGREQVHVIPWMALMNVPIFVVREIEEYKNATIRDIMVTFVGHWDHAGVYHNGL